MARRGDSPALLAHVQPRYRVPDYGIALTTLVALLVVAFGTIQTIVSAAAFTILIYYGITNAAALRLADEQRLYPRWISVAGLAGCVGLALSQSVHHAHRVGPAGHGHGLEVSLPVAGTHATGRALVASIA